MGFAGFIEGLLPNYVANLLPSNNVVGALSVGWAFAIFYIARWWLRNFRKNWRPVLVPSAIGGIILLGAAGSSIILAERPNPVGPIKSAQVARDPDAIYQMNTKVGTVVAPQIDLSNSTATFSRIENAPDFDVSREFDYRDYVLMFKSKAAETRSIMSGVRARALHGVIADIIRKRSDADQRPLNAKYSDYWLNELLTSARETRQAFCEDWPIANQTRAGMEKISSRFLRAAEIFADDPRVKRHIIDASEPIGAMAMTYGDFETYGKIRDIDKGYYERSRTKMKENLIEIENAIPALRQE